MVAALCPPIPGLLGLLRPGQVGGYHRAKEKIIQTKPGIAGIGLAEVVPESVKAKMTGNGNPVPQK